MQFKMNRYSFDWFGFKRGKEALASFSIFIILLSQYSYFVLLFTVKYLFI